MCLCVAAGAALWLGGCAAAPDLSSRQWRECPSPTPVSLRGLCASSDKVAFVSGAGGIVLRTLDGGISWEPMGPRDAGTLDFRAIAAQDQDRAVVANAGSPARVYATLDGGAHWTLVHEDARPAAFFDSLALDAEGHGFLLGDPIDGRFVLLATVDGGATWRDVAAAMPPAVAGEAAFAASNGCIALPAPRAVCLVTGGTKSRALVSSDNGAHWHASELPLLHGKPSQGAFAVAFADALHGVVVGGDYEDAAHAAGTAAWTDDGGVTWHAADVGPAGYRSGVAAIPGSRTFLAVGPTGASVSNDGGRTWQAYGELGFHTVRAAPDGAIWAAGSGGRIAKLVAR